MTTMTSLSKEEALQRVAYLEQRYDYDVTYVRTIIEADLDAYQAFETFAGQLGSYVKDIPVDALFAAKLTGALQEDCGPCTQLGVKFAEEAGIAPQIIRAILEGDKEAMSEDVRLVYEFSVAALGHHEDADAYREQILGKWGVRALISISYGLIASRSYPTLRYSMGYGQACTRVMVNGEPAKLKEH